MCLALKKSQLPDTLCGAIADLYGMAIALLLANTFPNISFLRFGDQALCERLRLLRLQTSKN